MIGNSLFNYVNHFSDWSVIIDWPHSDVILAASGKIRDNVEALGAEQVDYSFLWADQVLIKFLKRLCETES